MIKTNITSRHFKAHDTLTDYLVQEINSLEKYQVNIIHADAILFFEKATNSVKICEIIVKLKEKTLTAKESSDDFVKSIDKAVQKIQTQLLKHKDKTTDRKGAKALKQ